MSIYREEKRRAKRREKVEGVVLILFVVGLGLLLMFFTGGSNQEWCDKQREIVRTSPMEWGGFAEWCGDY
jgi:hypothetical protein